MHETEHLEKQAIDLKVSGLTLKWKIKWLKGYIQVT
jgi:hypothetical protein